MTGNLRPRRSAAVLGLSALGLAALTAPAARAQTILSGHYDNAAPNVGTGYRSNGAPGTDSLYSVVPSATFNNNSSVGLYLEADGGPILANIYGGSFSNNGDYGLYVASLVYTAAANIYGGSFGSNGSFGILAQQKGIVNIYGGTFANNVAADLFNFSNTAVITLYGSDFTQNNAALPYGALSGDVTTPRSLTGRLQNNSTVQTFTYRGNIILAPGATAVPEPSPFALLGLGLPALGVLVRRRVRK